MSKHTAAPWRATPYSSIVGIAISGQKGVPICGVRGDADQAEANAALITAAPDLLAALQGLMHWLVEESTIGGTYTDARNVAVGYARAALSKAEAP